MINLIRKFINWVKSFFVKKEVEPTFKRIDIPCHKSPTRPAVSPLQKPENLQSPTPRIIVTPPVNAPYHYSKPAYDRRYLNVYNFMGMPRPKAANRYAVKKNSKLSTLAMMR